MSSKRPSNTTSDDFNKDSVARIRERSISSDEGLILRTQSTEIERKRAHEVEEESKDSLPNNKLIPSFSSQLVEYKGKGLSTEPYDEESEDTGEFASNGQKKVKKSLKKNSSLEIANGAYGMQGPIDAAYNPKS